MLPKRPRRRASTASLVTAYTKEDGTQCERSMQAKKPETQRQKTKYPGGKAMKNFVATTMKTGVNGLIAEFLKLRQETQPIAAKPKTAFENNPEKNRYKDVYCNDETRDKEPLHRDAVQHDGAGQAQVRAAARIRIKHKQIGRLNLFCSYFFIFLLLPFY